jgi:predicted RNase H-like HicB family nuclease
VTSPLRLSDARILVEIRADDLDGGYVASVVGLPGCLSQGETVGEALRNIADAYEGVRDTLAALDRDLSA